VLRISGTTLMLLDGYQFEANFYGRQGVDRAVAAKITNLTTGKSMSQKFRQVGGNNLALAMKWFTDLRALPSQQRAV